MAEVAGVSPTQVDQKTPTDLPFVQTAASQASAALTTAAPRPATGLVDFQPDDFDVESDVSYYDSFASAFSDSGIVTGFSRESPVTVPDPDYDMDAHLGARPDDLKFIQQFLKRPNDPLSGSVISRLASSRSAAETDLIIQQTRDSQKRLEEAVANGWFPFLAGTLSGIGVDVAAAMGLTATTGIGGLAPLAARGATAARGLAALRIAALGAAEAGAERAAQQRTNPLIADFDILEAAGFGAGAGAILGIAMPTFLGNVRRMADDVAEPHGLTEGTIQEAAEASGRLGSTAGAQATTRPIEPARGSGSLIAKALPKSLQENALRNPKRVIADIGVKGTKERDELGRTGNLTFFDTMVRTLRLSTVMADEVSGTAARAASVQDVRDQFRGIRITREVEVSNEYDEALADVFDVTGASGRVRRAVRNSSLIPLEKRLLSQEEYEALADELAIARGDELLDEVDIIPEEIANRMTAEQQSKLMAHLEKSATKEDEFYQRFGELEVKHGLIKEEELIPGYRPQRWNRHEIDQDPEGFKLFLLETFSKNPNDNWIRQNYFRVADDGTQTPVLEDGEFFPDLAKREPELAALILEDWGAEIKRAAVDRAARVRGLRDAEMSKVRDDNVEQITERLRAKLEKDNQLFNKVNKRLADSTDKVERNKIAIRLGKIEKRIHDNETKLDTLKKLERNTEQVDQFVGRYGNVRQKKATTKALKRLGAASRKEARTEARRVLTEELDAIQNQIANGKSPFGFMDPEFVQSSSRFIRRAIHLKRNRFRPEARRFLHTSTHDARAAYESSVGTQIALREVFGDIIERAGDDFSIDNIRDHALRGFKNDLAKAKTAKERNAIAKDMVRAQQMFNHIFRELTHADITDLKGLSKTLSDIANVANTATAAMALGSVVLAQIGDIAVMTMAGGRLGTGFRFMWRRGLRKHMAEIAKDEGEIAVLLQGLSTVDGSRFRALADIDTSGFDLPGSKFRTIMRTVDEIAKIEGWMNLMHVWNTIIRGGFGLDFARQIDKDLAQWTKLPAYLRTFYAKHGIDQQTAEAMTDMMNRSHRKFVNGHLRLPDSHIWSNEAPDLLMKYKMLIKSAGDEAMIDPNVGDRPFLRSNAAGRIILQFQSFMFTAGERYIAPMIQEMRLHPTSIRPYIGALAGLFMGATSDGFKAAARGDFEEWNDRWNHPTKWTDNLWSAVLRSPMMAGPSGTLLDIALSQYGRVLNENVTEPMLGSRIFREEATRFRENQAAWALLGPSTNTLMNTVIPFPSKVLDDPEEAMKSVSRRLPITNIFYLQTLMNLENN